MVDFLNAALNITTYIILGYFFLINTFYVIFMFLSFFGIFRYQNVSSFVKVKEIFHLPLIKPISIIVPAYNEEQTIIESVQSLLNLEYPLYEVIVVNDGSTDLTLEKLILNFRLKKTYFIFRKSIETKPIKAIYTSSSNQKLIVVDKISGQKADALNVGLNISHYPLFCAIDSDSILEKDALLKVVRPFIEDPERTIAAGGIIRLSNGCVIKRGKVIKVGLPRNFLARFQIIEYLRAFLGGRVALNLLHILLIISGAFGVFRKDIALECGGYRPGTIGEDIDLVVRMKKYLHEKKRPNRIYFIPDPICWTEAPTSLKSLANQRKRWHIGLIETLVYNIKMLFNPGYGLTGLLAMPFYLIFEMFGPLIEFVGYIIFIIFIIWGKMNYPYTFLFLLLAVIFGTFISLLSILLEEYSPHRYSRLWDILILSLFAFAENILYRQFLTVVRISAFFYFFLGKKEWGEIEKKGFLVEAAKT